MVAKPGARKWTEKLQRQRTGYNLHAEGQFPGLENKKPGLLDAGYTVIRNCVLPRSRNCLVPDFSKGMKYAYMRLSLLVNIFVNFPRMHQQEWHCLDTGLFKQSLSLFIALFLLSSYSASRLRVTVSNITGSCWVLPISSCPPLLRQLLDMPLVFHSQAAIIVPIVLIAFWACRVQLLSSNSVSHPGRWLTCSCQSPITFMSWKYTNYLRDLWEKLPRMLQCLPS